ncbi:MAG: response regulator [Pseudomonadales bacterium]|nr:response regulator [Pseudomonadales bacterium]NIX07482.1 response regulator [Pseudomonadales bacterium]
MVSIAVVDDDAAILDAMTLLAESRGWLAKVFASGEAFLDAFEQDRDIDCVVLDPHLEGMGGDHVADVVAGTGVPVVGLTARPESPVTQSIMQSGAAAMLTKPVRPDELVSAIERLLLN